MWKISFSGEPEKGAVGSATQTRHYRGCSLRPNPVLQINSPPFSTDQPHSFDLWAPPSCGKDASCCLASPLLSYARIHVPAVLLAAPLPRPPCPPGLCTYLPSLFFFIYFSFFYAFYCVLANWVINDLGISPLYVGTHVIDSATFFINLVLIWSKDVALRKRTRCVDIRRKGFRIPCCSSFRTESKRRGQLFPPLSVLLFID